LDTNLSIKIISQNIEYDNKLTAVETSTNHVWLQYRLGRSRQHLRKSSIKQSTYQNWNSLCVVWVARYATHMCVFKRNQFVYWRRSQLSVDGPTAQRRKIN